MPRVDLLELAELQHEDPELVPEILPVDARLSVRGPVATFISLFERAASVTPIKETIPGTGHALIETFSASASEVAHVRLTASDGEQTVSVVADGLTVLMEGRVLLPPKKILEILKKAPQDTIRIEVLGNTTTLRSGRAQWTVQIPNGDALPAGPDVDEIDLHAVPRAGFLRALEVARRALATAGRPSLMQAQVRAGAITATDGGRVHRQSIEGFPDHLDMAIPSKVVDELIRALRATKEEHVDIGANDWHLVFRIGQDSIIGQRLMVAFPVNVEGLLLGPAFSNVHSLTFDRAELGEVIKRVRVNADPDRAAIFLALVPGKKDSSGELSWSLAVRSKDRNGNGAQEVMECQYVGDGKARELCVNHHYLSDFLDSYDGDLAIFKLGDDTKTSRTPMFLEDVERGFTGIVVQMNSAWA